MASCPRCHHSMFWHMDDGRCFAPKCECPEKTPPDHAFHTKEMLLAVARNKSLYSMLESVRERGAEYAMPRSYQAALQDNSLRRWAKFLMSFEASAGRVVDESIRRPKVAEARRIQSAVEARALQLQRERETKKWLKRLERK